MSKILEIAFRTIEIESKSILDLKLQLDQNFDGAVIEILRTGGKLIVTGMGKSGIIGKKIAATMASTGTPSFYMHPGEAFHGDLGMIEENDIILAISNSGETDEVLKLLPFFEDNRNKVISMTGNPQSTLAINSNFHLNIQVEKEACPLKLAPTSSTTATLVMGDALAVSLMEMRGFKEENFARFHPGGSLGRRLLIKAKDVMRSDSLPIIRKDTMMLDIIHTMTRGRLGLAIVCDGLNIEGIITDGDMRRTFEKDQEMSFKLNAENIMTVDPKCIAPHERLVDVQSIMNEEKINSLLVTRDGEGTNLIGVIQLYDVS